jgi:hypothetical protein
VTRGGGKFTRNGQGDIISIFDIKESAMVRTVISLDLDDKAWLDRQARRERIPMTRLVRRAVKRLRQESEAKPSGFERLLRETSGMQNFGNALSFQRKLRGEWGARK